MNPKISIVTITFNSERTVEETIQSVVSQDYDNLEYIIVDGASLDNTLEIVNKYRDKIAKVISEPDKGISDAFNKGIALATGEIIGIINSDDLLLPGALRAIADNYEKEVDVYRGNTVLWEPETETRLSTKPTMEFSIKESIKSVCHQSTFIRKEAYEKYGKYDLRFNYMMDSDVLRRFANRGAIFKYINIDLAVFRQGGLTSDNWRKKLKEIELLVLNNGGTRAIAYYRVFKFSVHTLVKRIMFFFLGKKRSRALYYRGSSSIDVA